MKAWATDASIEGYHADVFYLKKLERDDCA